MYNHVELVGRIGHDPEIRTSQSGKKVCRISLATNSFFGGQQRTDWHNVVLFERNAEICEKHAKKGSKIMIDGSIQYNRYEGKNGVAKTTTNIIANKIILLDFKDEQQGSIPSVNSDGTPAFGSEVNPNEPDEIPF